jgi:Adaptive response protein AidB N-terminal domain
MSSSSDPPHSTAYSGFFQSPPSLKNPFTQDHLLHRILRRHLGDPLFKTLAPDFESLADEVISPQILAYCDDAHHNLPEVIHWDGWGIRKDELRTTEGWRKLKEFWARSGLMDDFYTRPHGAKSRVVGFTKSPFPFCIES